MISPGKSFYREKSDLCLCVEVLHNWSVETSFEPYLDNACIKVPPVHVAAVVDDLFKVFVDTQGELTQQGVAGHGRDRWQRPQGSRTCGRVVKQYECCMVQGKARARAQI